MRKKKKRVGGDGEKMEWRAACQPGASCFLCYLQEMGGESARGRRETSSLLSTGREMEEEGGNGEARMRRGSLLEKKKGLRTP